MMNENIQWFQQRFKEKLSTYKLKVTVFDNPLKDSFGDLTSIEFQRAHIDGMVNFYSRGVLYIEVFDWEKEEDILNILSFNEDDHAEAFKKLENLL